MCFPYSNKPVTLHGCDVGNMTREVFYQLIFEILLYRLVLVEKRQLNDKIRLGYYFSLTGLRLKSLRGYSFETIRLLIK